MGWMRGRFVETVRRFPGRNNENNMNYTLVIKCLEEKIASLAAENERLRYMLIRVVTYFESLNLGEPADNILRATRSTLAATPAPPVAAPADAPKPLSGEVTAGGTVPCEPAAPADAPKLADDLGQLTFQIETYWSIVLRRTAADANEWTARAGISRGIEKLKALKEQILSMPADVPLPTPIPRNDNHNKKGAQ